MKILSKNYVGKCSNWAEYALITIDAATKKEILEAKELHQMVKSKNGSLHAMEFWDNRPEYFSCDEAGLTQEQADELEENGFMVVPDETTIADFPGAEESRTACDCLVVYDDGFFWSAVHKYSEDAVETKLLKFELFLK